MISRMSGRPALFRSIFWKPKFLHLPAFLHILPIKTYTLLLPCQVTFQYHLPPSLLQTAKIQSSSRRHISHLSTSPFHTANIYSPDSQTHVTSSFTERPTGAEMRPDHCSPFISNTGQRLASKRASCFSARQAMQHGFFDAVFHSGVVASVLRPDALPDANPSFS